jgi:hypothetical protein
MRPLLPPLACHSAGGHRSRDIQATMSRTRKRESLSASSTLAWMFLAVKGAAAQAGSSGPRLRKYTTVETDQRIQSRETCAEKTCRQ